MELVAEIKTFRPKKGAPVIEDNKVYEFELVTRYEKSRPVDKETGTPLGSGYPPSYGYPNQGVAFNHKTKQFEQWRLIRGQKSIFVSEQKLLENYEEPQIARLLSQTENIIEFRDGKLLVRGDEAGRLMLDALFALDYFEGNEHKFITPTKLFMFRLNNPDAVTEQLNDMADLEFEVMKQVNEKTTVTEMLATCLLLGINIDDRSEAGLARIKQAFRSRAKYDPKNPKALETFHEILNNPATKMKFLFSQGITKGILSASQQPGKLTWAKLQTPILDLNGRQTPVDELTARAMNQEKIVVELLTQLEGQLNNVKPAKK